MTKTTNRTATTLRARALRPAVAALAVAAVGLPLAAGPASASPATASPDAATRVDVRHHPHPFPHPAPHHGASRDLVAASRGVVEAGSVGHLALVGDGRRVTGVATGLADRATGRPLRLDDQFEIGSNTKTFTAVLALQLVARGELGLDDTVEHHLPGVVPGGDAITVRMLLQHTSGLYSFTGDEPFFRSLLADPRRVWTPEQLVAIATSHDPTFPPGQGWSYSNTNYIVAGMIIEKVSGRELPDLVRDRIARPLGLRHTELLRGAAPRIGPGYAHGYLIAFDDAGRPEAWTDVSDGALGGWAGAAGAVLSTPAELARFYSALLQGRLLPKAQLAQMQTTVPLPDGFGPYPGGYGLGLIRTETPCGTVWGHGGDTLGHHSTVALTADGRRFAITDTTSGPNPLDGPTPPAQKLADAMGHAEEAAVCAMVGKPVPKG
ncbi:MAG: serine hydrolase domain-containing protein [Kineosporiaceae bacterium]